MDNPQNTTPKKKWYRKWWVWLIVFLAFGSIMHIVIEEFLGAIVEEKLSASNSASVEVLQHEEPEMIAEETQALKETPIQETLAQDQDNLFMQLSQDDTDTYLLLLRIIGASYIDLNLTEDMFAEMQKNEQLQGMVEDILDYRISDNDILPDFSDSFAQFFTSERDVNDYPEEREALLKSFDLKYNVPARHWTITPLPSILTAGEVIALQKYIELGYTLATPNNLFNGVKIYAADSPDDDMVHHYTVLGFGNDGLMKDYVFVSDLWMNRETWIHIDELTDDGLHHDGWGRYSAWLVKLDDPAQLNAQRTFKAVEADNFRRITADDLVPLKDVYSLRNDGTMRWDFTIGETKGFLNLTTTIFRTDHLDFEDVDTSWVLSNHYVAK